MCILHIVFCTVCKYVLSICKLFFFVCVFLHCLENARKNFTRTCYVRNRDVPYQSVTFDVTSDDRRIGIPTKRPHILSLPVSHGSLLHRYFLAQVRAPIGRPVTGAMALPTKKD